MDPYLQVDAWTMSPYEHGEVFVTDDWGETDLDLWNYERFLWIWLTKDHNITTGKVYQNVISKERNGEYNGKTVQIIPHITNEIKENIYKIAETNDITLIEVWWTVWDIESLPFLEAIRQCKRDIWKNNVFYVHISLLLKLDFSGEVKTKPIQHTVVKLREYGIQPDMLVCRTSDTISKPMLEKISMLCDIDMENIIEWKNVSTIYDVPEKFANQNVDQIILQHFWFKNKKADLQIWNSYIHKIIHPKNTINIAVVGKYTWLEDTYKSIHEALIHAWAHCSTQVKIHYIDAEILENEFFEEKLDNIKKAEKLDGILIPGWFWNRWVEWKIHAVHYARKNKIPFLWICLWMQVAVIEFARNVANISDADSAESENKSKNYVIDIMDSQKNIKKMWWTLRVWSYDAVLKKWSLAEKLYQTIKISERHRHRFEVNPNYHDILEKSGLIISGTSVDKKLVEFIELKNHPFFIATQAHPEFKSSLEKSHPLFLWFIQASVKCKK